MMVRSPFSLLPPTLKYYLNDHIGEINEANERNEIGNKQSRAQRTFAAVDEVSSFVPQEPSRGIDARSLAAEPPPRFAITRMQVGSGRGAIAAGRGGYVSRGSRMGGMGMGRGGAGRGRGGGMRGGRGRGRGGTRGRGKRGPQFKLDTEEEIQEPWNEEERIALAEWEQGVPTPYNPQTSLQDLMRHGPALATSTATFGLRESLTYKVQVATGNLKPLSHAADQLEGLAKGVGALFRSAEEKERLEKWVNKERKEWAQELGKEATPFKIESFNEEEKKKLLEEVVAGRYEGPKAVLERERDVLRLAENFASRNETYLPGDMRMLQDKLRALVPAPKQQSTGQDGKQKLPL